MKHEKINLKEIFPKLPNDTYIYTYLPDNSPEIDINRIRPTVVICPGGGYGMTSDREAEPVALKYIAEGYNAVIVRYSVAPAVYPTQLLEAAAAVAAVRKNAKEWNVDTKKVFIEGFSAGGHLAASVGILWKERIIPEVLGVPNEFIRPDGMILAYPVITSGKMAHRGSFDSLLGDNKDNREMLEKVSLEKQVDDDTIPAFIWHTTSDGAVPVENSLMLAAALEEHKISFELHIFPKGQHGLSLCSELTMPAEPAVAPWMNLSLTWIENFDRNKEKN